MHRIKDIKVIWRAIANFVKCESGVAMVEYTILLGIVTVAVIASIILVGAWISGEWNTLIAALGGPPVCCANAAAANVQGNCCS